MTRIHLVIAKVDEQMVNVEESGEKTIIQTILDRAYIVPYTSPSHISCFKVFLSNTIKGGGSGQLICF